jgi:uncharacterized metal-binding protein
MSGKDKALPLVYSYSGCSNAAQMANHVALQMDRRAIAEMSCIAGIGGDVPALVRLAASGRTLMVIDGCPVACVRKCLARHGLAPNIHFELSAFGVRKRLHADFDAGQALEMVERACDALATGAAQAACR